MIYVASNEINVMDVDSIDFNSELRQIEREINRYKPTLQSSRDERENVETEICNTRQLQRKAQFVLDNVRLEEENLHEHFKKIRLNYEECKERSSDDKDPTETVRARMSELAARRKELLKELTRLRKNVDDNEKKLAHVKAMLAEQEVNSFNIRPIDHENSYNCYKNFVL